MRLILVFTFSLFISFQIFSQVKVSEYSASNLNQFSDDYLKYEDWIEIYNDSDSAVDIGGWGVSDKESKPQKWQFPEGTMIGAREYLVVWCSGRDDVRNGHYHTNFKLTQTKGNEYIALSDAEGNLLESQLMELTLLGHSRVKDSNGAWMISEDPTPKGIGNPVEYKMSYTAEPTINIEAGYYEETQTVSITNNQADSELRYSTDGWAPTLNSPIYTAPIEVSSTTVIKARSFPLAANQIPGKINFKTVFINEDHTVPVISIAADSVQMLANGEGEIRPIGSIEYFTTDKKLSSTSYGELNRHGQDSWILDHRSIDWVSRDEMGYNKELNEQMFSYSDRDGYQRFMLRASGDDNYPANDDFNHVGSCHIRDEYVQQLAQDGGLKLDVRAVERAVVFLNGRYWGLYSPRERPADHDYTGYYYDQGKYDLQYILTWGETWAEYGGSKALSEWAVFREFILTNDMSVPENYQRVKDEMQVLGLIDYFIINLTAVSSDWINYNTGWWRGLNPEGDHKKWGYILWDNDATFDYYINYSGVPNTDPDAEPCDLDDIADAMDEFWGGDNTFITPELIAFCTSVTDGSCPYPADDPILFEVMLQDFSCCFGGWNEGCEELYNQIASDTTVTTISIDDCLTIMNGSCPHEATDSIAILVMQADEFCCDTQWDDVCDDIYESFENGTNTEPGDDEPFIYSNFGSHEKILLKLIDENPDFKQLYYSRHADLNNTVFSCDNMLKTFDKMVDDIAPEMPKQIERWGGSMEEWEGNVQEMRTFIETRCDLLDDGLMNCFDLTGPHNITLEVEPAGAGRIEFNTLKVNDLPWTGQYFGGMENLIDADAEDDYYFVRWESKAGNVIFPNELEENAKITLMENDTLVAIFSNTVSTEDDIDDQIGFSAYPSPTSGELNISYHLKNASDVNIQILNTLGQQVYKVVSGESVLSNESYLKVVDMNALGLQSGVYYVQLQTNKKSVSKKVLYVE